MSLSVVAEPIPGLVVLEPTVHGDDRGFFMESWNHRSFIEAVGEDIEFVQDNHSRSSKGVLRGLHYQLPPSPQGKLVRVVAGRIWDVAVDIRRSSPTFGSWYGAELTDQNHRQLWIPPGFAHGFVVLSDAADVLYKTSGYYDAAADRSLRWDDPTIGIEWPYSGEVVLSAKDQRADTWDDAEVFG